MSIRPLAVLVVIGLVARVVSLDAQSTAPASLAERTFAAYEAGNVAEIDRVLTLERDALVSDVEWHIPTWKRAWSPRKIAFTLEVAKGALRTRAPLAGALIDRTRDMVIARPERPGTNPAHDAFEAAVHKAAMALLIAHGRFDDAEEYYTLIERRLAAPRATRESSPTRLIDPRLRLQRAIARDGNTRALTGITLAEALSGVLPVKAVSPAVARNRSIQQRVNDAHDALKDAAQDPATAAEAIVRRAYLYFRSGNAKQAEALILSAPKTDDPVVGYWGGLVLARAAGAQGRPADAAVVYEVLARLAPDTQTIPIALTALRLEQGDRSAALMWADRARSTPQNRIDPWSMYWPADARFIDTWLAEIRAVRE